MPLSVLHVVRSRTPLRAWSARAVGLCTAALAACGDGTSPGDPSVAVAVAAGDAQYGVPDGVLDEPLVVLVTEATTSEPVEDVDVDWRVTSGSASILPARSTTDALGIARATVRLGPQPGGVVIEATATGGVGEPVRFVATAIEPPRITSIEPAMAGAGESITITGTGFPETPDAVAVLFDGLRGEITGYEPGTIVVTVPSCMLDRTAGVRVLIGAVSSQPEPIETVAADAPPLDLDRGEVLRVDAASDLDCFRFDGAAAGDAYLVIPQNATDAVRLPVRWELVGRIGWDDVATLAAPRASRVPAVDFELALRSRERSLFAGTDVRSEADDVPLATAAQPPQIGDRRNFNVLVDLENTERITAEVRAISQHAVLYVDLDTPGGGFDALDVQRFGALFDDPIYETEVDIFGSPTDVDGNDRIIILFTPRVNALTEPGQDSFIAGYFYGCDLVTASRCSDTNRGEIFYSMVPDPQGRFGDSRSRDLVLRTVPGILAHEFQHMIHFGQKGELDALWLSEGLAHAAEDRLGEVFASRGDAATASEFQTPNYLRASRYLLATGSTSLIDEDSPGTLQLRGGAWLLVRYISEHYGGDELLGRLTRSSLDGTSNVTAETGEPWDRLLGDFAVALWADDAPELADVPLDARFTLPGIDLRGVIGRFTTGFTLQPPELQFADFLASDTLPSSAQAYFIVKAPSSPPPFNLSFGGVRGGPFPANTRMQISVLRIR